MQTLIHRPVPNSLQNISTKIQSPDALSRDVELKRQAFLLAYTCLDQAASTLPLQEQREALATSQLKSSRLLRDFVNSPSRQNLELLKTQADLSPGVIKDVVEHYKSVHEPRGLFSQLKVQFVAWATGDKTPDEQRTKRLLDEVSTLSSMSYEHTKLVTQSARILSTAYANYHDTKDNLDRSVKLAAHILTDDPRKEFAHMFSLGAEVSLKQRLQVIRNETLKSAEKELRNPNHYFDRGPDALTKFRYQTVGLFTNLQDSDFVEKTINDCFKSVQRDIEGLKSPRATMLAIDAVLEKKKRKVASEELVALTVVSEEDDDTRLKEPLKPRSKHSYY